MLKVRRLPVFFRDGASWELDLPPEGRALREVLGEGEGRVAVEVNGERVEDLERAVHNGDEVEFCRRPSGFITAGVAAFLGVSKVTAAYIVGGIALAASIGVSILLRPKLPRPIDQEEDPRFSGSLSPSASGAVLPLVFGRVRVQALEVEKYVKPVYQLEEVAGEGPLVVGVSKEGEDLTLNARLAWAKGPIQSVSEIRIDDNPIENYGLSVRVQSVLGTNEHAPLEGFEEAPTPRTIGQLVTESTTSPDPGPHEFDTIGKCDAIEIEIHFPSGLYQIPPNSLALVSRRVQVEVQYARLGQPYQSLGALWLSDRRSSPLSKWLRISNLPFDRYSVKVLRLTADNSDPTIQDALRFETLVEYVSQQRIYPRVAQTGIRQIPQLQSTIFQTATALIEGLSDVRVYTSTTEYTTGFTRNAAWCCLYAYCDPVNGLGARYRYEEQDIQSFIDWAAHCDAKGYHFDYAMTGRVEGRDLADIFSGAYDAFLIDEGGRLRVELDAPAPPVTYLGPGDYRARTFSKERLRPKANSYFAIVPGDDTDAEEHPILHRDPTLPDGAPYVETTVALFGVRDPTHGARQLARAARKARLEDHAIELQAGFKAFPIKVGKVFRVASPSSRIGLAAGRVLQLVANKVELDQALVVNAARKPRLFDDLTV